jgi:hypothetical protein
MKLEIILVMIRRIDIATIVSRFFRKGGMLSNQDYF